MQVRFIPSQRMSAQGKQSEIWKGMEYWETRWR